MAGDINSVVLVGRLTRDAELKYTNTGLAVSKISLAINRRKKQNDQWVEEANFFDVTIWGKTAEALQPYLTKGKQIAVQGELRQSRWEQDGQARSKVEVVALSVQLLGGRSGNESGYQNSGGGGGYQRQGGGYQGGGYNNSQGGGYNNSQGGGGYQPQGGGPSIDPTDNFEDDIPF